MAPRHLLCAALACAVALAVVHTRPAGADGPSWVRPVDGEVVSEFAPPAARYGAGHLGVDFHATPGTAVRAVGPGEITYAGTVAGARHVVVTHAGGLRTSYSFLASIAVRRGQAVRGGETVGTSGDTGANHDRDVLHLGLRSGEEYVDPMLLFGAVDLASVVHLAPTAEPYGYTLADERRGLLEGLREGAAGFVGSATGAIGDGAAALTDGAVTGLTTGLAPVAELGTALGARYLDRAQLVLAGFPPTALVSGGLTTGQILYGYWREQQECDDTAPAADGTGGSGHRAMVVAGIDSHREENGRSLALPTSELGYLDDEVTYFSYAPDGAAYEPPDTYSPILESARRLGDQLREQQRGDTGREVDLIAHSQGGVVTLAFLKLVYDPADPAYPPLGTVVALASPLDGAPLATLIDEVRDVPVVGDVAVGAARDVAGGAVPDLRSPAVTDLAEDSSFMARLDAARLPESVRITSIGGLWDPTVPGDRATAVGADRTIVDTGPLWEAHADIVTDGDALRAIRAALEGRPLPCRSFDDYVRASLIPPAITLVETAAGGIPGTTGFFVPR